MQITRHKNVMEVEGTQPEVGEKAPDFTLLNLNMDEVSLSELLTKPLIISVVPDIDTRVCSLQTKRFNQAAAQETAVNFVTISNNSREEQANWCAAEGVDMLMLSDHEGDFGAAYGLFIPATGRLVRSIFVVNPAGRIDYQELVVEQTKEPDYVKALTAAKALI